MAHTGQGTRQPSSELGPPFLPAPDIHSYSNSHTTMLRAPTTFLASATKRVAATAFAPRVSHTPLLIRSLLPHQQHAVAMVATTPLRGFASKKDKGGKGVKGGKKNAKDDDDDEDSGSRKGKGKGAAVDSSEEMTFDLVDLEKKFSQCLERLKRDFMTMRAGTANPGNVASCILLSCICVRRGIAR